MIDCCHQLKWAILPERSDQNNGCRKLTGRTITIHLPDQMKRKHRATSGPLVHALSIDFSTS